MRVFLIYAAHVKNNETQPQHSNIVHTLGSFVVF